MKTLITWSFLTIAGTFSVAGLAAGNHDAHGAPAATNADAKAPAAAMSDGEIKKVDKASGKLTVMHGPLANLGMPAMTMIFKVKEAAWLKQLKPGDKIRFVAENIDGALTIVRYEPVR